MATPVNFDAMPPGQKFAFFVGEVVAVVGTACSRLEGYVIGRIEEAVTGNESLRALVDKVKASGDTISQAFFIIGCVYNFYTSPTLFLLGTGIGALASAAPFPVEFESLRQGELLGRTAEEGYAASKVMFGLASLNFYLGRTLLDDMSISIFSGLLAGNSFYQRFKVTATGAGISLAGNKLAELTELVLQKLPF